MNRYLIIFMTLFAVAAFAESYRRTTDDMYMDSYRAIIAERDARARIAAEQAKHGITIEICDEHHNCVKVNSLEPQKIEQELRRLEQNRESAKSRTFPLAPVFSLVRK